MKICKECNQPKPFENFSRASGGRSINSYCKPCVSLRVKRWRENLVGDAKIAYNKKHSERQKKRLPKVLQQQRLLRKLGLNTYEKEWRKNYVKQKRLSDPNFKLRMNLRHRIYLALKENQKISSSSELLGCGIQEFRTYIQNRFREGMTWENYGQWHIDHIKPCVNFNLSDPNQQKECFHFSNLQPLWAKDNLTKGATCVV